MGNSKKEMGNVILAKGTNIYTWSSDACGRLQAGIKHGGENVVFVQDVPTAITVPQARKLALELLRWADFVETPPDTDDIQQQAADKWEAETEAANR